MEYIDRFKIIARRRHTDKVLGECVVFCANQYKEFSGTGLICHDDYEGESTRYFVFPLGHPLVDQVHQIAQSLEDWTPNLNDFEKEDFRIEETGKIVTRYIHCCFQTDDYLDINSGNSICVIPNVAYKRRLLTNQYVEYMRENYTWNPMGKDDYLLSLAEEDANFFSWLFDDNRLFGRKGWDLNPEQYEAWQNFYMEFCD